MRGLDSSEARKSKIPATSSAVQDFKDKSPCLFMAPIMLISKEAGLRFMVMGVMIFPGQTALQRIYRFASSMAVCLVIPIIAALEAT